MKFPIIVRNPTSSLIFDEKKRINEENNRKIMFELIYYMRDKMVYKMCQFPRQSHFFHFSKARYMVRNFCLGNFSRVPQFCLGKLDLPSKLPKVPTLMLHPALP